MPRFKFSLEPVLQYKASLVELLQMELATLQQHAREARAVLAALTAEREHTNAVLRDKLNQGQLDIDTVTRYRTYLEDLSERLSRQESVVADLEAQVADKRQELIEVQQDEEMLTELKQRQFDHFLEKLDQVEARLIDESAIANFNRLHTTGPRKPKETAKVETAKVEPEG